MIGWSDLLWGGVLPAIVAASVLAVVWELTGKAASAWRTAIVAGYVAGHWALDARGSNWLAAISHSFRPREAHDWLPLLLLLAMLPDAIACFGKQGSVIGWLLRTGLCLLVPWRLLYGSRYLPLLQLPDDFGFDMGAWSTDQATAWIAGIGTLFLLCWLIVQNADRNHTILPRSLLAVTVACGAAITAALSGSLIYGQFFGVLTATLVGASLTSVLLQVKRSPEAATGPVVIAYGSLLMLAYFYAELKTHNLALLLLAMTFAIGWLPLPKQLSPHWQIAGRCAACLAALAVAVSLASLDFIATQATTESNPYGQNPYEKL